MAQIVNLLKMSLFQKGDVIISKEKNSSESPSFIISKILEIDSWGDGLNYCYHMSLRTSNTEPPERWETLLEANPQSIYKSYDALTKKLMHSGDTTTDEDEPIKKQMQNILEKVRNQPWTHAQSEYLDKHCNMLVMHSPLSSVMSFDSNDEDDNNDGGKEIILYGQEPIQESELKGFLTYLELTDYSRYLLVLNKAQTFDEVFDKYSALFDQALNCSTLEEGIALYKECLKIHPKLFEAWDNIAINYRDLQRFDEALEACEESLAIEPNNVDTIRLAIHCCKKLGSGYEKMIEQFTNQLQKAMSEQE